MFLLGFILFFGGIGLVMGLYQDKQRFMRTDYTEKDIESYQRNLMIGFGIIVVGFTLFFA